MSDSEGDEFVYDYSDEDSDCSNDSSNNMDDDSQPPQDKEDSNGWPSSPPSKLQKKMSKEDESNKQESMAEEKEDSGRGKNKMMKTEDHTTPKRKDNNNSASTSSSSSSSSNTKNPNPNAPPNKSNSANSKKPNNGHSPVPEYLSPNASKDPNGLKLMESEDLRIEMDLILNEISDMLCISSIASACLLRQFKWNKERLIEAYMSDPEKTLKASGVYLRVNNEDSSNDMKLDSYDAPIPVQANVPNSPQAKPNLRLTRSISANKAAAASSSTSTTATATTQQTQQQKNAHLLMSNKPVNENGLHTCQICCCDDIEEKDIYSMPCTHEFCTDCWSGFLGHKIGEGPTSVYAVCPMSGCKEFVTDVEVEAITPNLLAKYRVFQLRSFVDLFKNARWCPGLDCTKVAISKSGFGDVNCDCGRDFCVRCGEEPHQPVVCTDLAMWNEKCQNESETANWILANTKKCPKCYTRIEKNQGCNHITCQQCKFDFCWICCAPWKDHGSTTGGYYKCNKFAAEDDGKDQSDSAKAKRELDRYLHYYQRFHAHDQAQKFAKKQLQETEARMIKLQEEKEETSWIDVQFLKAATEQLVQCRRVLKFTYTFAFYLDEKSGKKERFEDHQEMLERFTEKLSELSEKPLDKMDRTEVINHTRVVDRFVRNILKYVDDGMDEE